MTRNPTILVGVDASARSEDAIAFTARLARSTHARVVVVSAFAYDTSLFLRGAPTTLRDVLRDEAEETAVAMARKLTGVPDERVSIALPADPSPAHALHTLAVSAAADLIVVGSTHTGRLDRVLPGSTGEALLHGTPCPVVVIPNGYRHPQEDIERVGAAYDRSPESTAAVHAAHAAARALDAELQIVSVADTRLHFMPATHASPPGESLTELRRTLDADLESLVAQLDDPRVSAVTLEGDAAEQLAEHSAQLDLLVTGSRGYGPLHAVLTGGVSGRLVRSASCPLIVVPRGVDAPLGELFAPGALAR